MKIQLKIFTPVGMRDQQRREAEHRVGDGPMPTENMWCAHTPNPRKPIRIPEYTITGYPNSGFFEFGGQHFGHEPEGRQNQDVDLWVPEDPEEVLPE